MNTGRRTNYMLTSSDAMAPTSSSYWVVPGLLLAGAYPGSPDPEEHRAKIKALLDAGIRAFVNLMEETETNLAGQLFVPYDDVVSQGFYDAVC